MGRFPALFVAAFCASARFEPADAVDPGTQLAAAQALAARVLPPALAARLRLSVTPPAAPPTTPTSSEHGAEPPPVGVLALPKPSFSIGPGPNGTVALDGTTGVALASALRRVVASAGGQLGTWFTSTTPATLPQPHGTVTVTSPFALSHYLNVCAFGYSTAWWDWPRWEREIDWMALNGVNAPLAMVGQDAIWLDVFTQDFGLDKAELLDEFFVSPAYQPWHWMGNLNGYEGSPSHGTTEGFLRRQLDLQRKIVTRMVSLGMMPVLTAFAGHVPASLALRYPSARVTHLPAWHGHMVNGTYTLDPTDPLYVKIGRAFVARQLAAMAGTGWELDGTGAPPRLYLADPYNEMLPPSIDPAYIRNVSNAIYEGMAGADPDAVWVAQAWFLGSAPASRPSPKAPWGWNQLDAFLRGPPLGRLLMLDLNAVVNPVWQRTRAFLGVPFLWCAIENFGGRSGTYSSGLANIASSPARALVGGGGRGGRYSCVHFTAKDEAKCAGLPPDKALACQARVCTTDYHANFSHDANGNAAFPGCGTCWCCAKSNSSSSSNSTNGTTPVRMLGVGMTPEGIETNPLVFSLIAETMWHNGTGVDLGVWLQRFTLGRRGLASKPPSGTAAGAAADSVAEAVAVLASTVYNGTALGWGNQGTVGSAIAARPSFHPSVPDTSVDPFFAPADVARAWALLVNASLTDAAGCTAGARYDLVDVGQMVASAVFSAQLADLSTAYAARDAAALARAGAALLEVVDDADSLLRTSEHHLFGAYLASAEANGVTPDEVALFRASAKRIVTVWGYPVANGTQAQRTHNSGLSEYAFRLWAGLLSSYYRPRWEAFVDALAGALRSGAPFDQAAFDASVVRWELAWVANASVDSEAVGVAAVGDTVAKAAALLRKWEPALQQQQQRQG